MPTAPRFLRAICRAYSTAIQRGTLEISGRFNDALNNTHKDLEAPHEPKQEQEFFMENATPAAIQGSLQVFFGHNSNTA